MVDVTTYVTIATTTTAAVIFDQPSLKYVHTVVCSSRLVSTHRKTECGTAAASFLTCAVHVLNPGIINAMPTIGPHAIGGNFTSLHNSTVYHENKGNVAGMFGLKLVVIIEKNLLET